MRYIYFCENVFVAVSEQARYILGESIKNNRVD